MLTQRPVLISNAFGRQDLRRLIAAAGLLVAAMTLTFALDLIPTRIDVQVGDVARTEIVAPRAGSYISDIQTAEARAAASEAVPSVYDFTSEKAITIANAQLRAFARLIQPIDRAFEEGTPAAERKSLLDSAVSTLSDDARITLVGMQPDRWKLVKAEASRVLDATERAELRDTAVETKRLALSGEMAGGLDDAERRLAAELISPLVVANSSYSEVLTAQARARAAEGVAPIRIEYAQNEAIVQRGQKITPIMLEAMEKLGLTDVPAPGENYQVKLGTGEEISGKVWYRTSHQVGLTVHSYAEHGEGLLVVADHPAIKDVREEGEGSLVIVSTYDLGAARLESVRSSWDAWRAGNYPASEPVS